MSQLPVRPTIFDLPADIPIRLSIITSSGVSQYTQGDQTLLEHLDDPHYPRRDVAWTTVHGTWPIGTKEEPCSP